MKKVPGRDARGGDRHEAILTARTSGAKAPCFARVCGTAEEPALSEAERVPLSKTVRASLKCAFLGAIRMATRFA
jgi:hypothetical protein